MDDDEDDAEEDTHEDEVEAGLQHFTAMYHFSMSQPPRFFALNASPKKVFHSEWRKEKKNVALLKSLSHYFSIYFLFSISSVLLVFFHCLLFVFLSLCQYYFPYLLLFIFPFFYFDFYIFFSLLRYLLFSF